MAELGEDSCCAKHRVSLIKESVGLPLLALAELNFLQCFRCRSRPPVALMPAASSGASSPPPSLHEFYHEYSAAVSSRSLRSRDIFLKTPGSKKHYCCKERGIIEQNEIGGDDDGASPGGTDDDEGQLPLHLLLSNFVLSHLPLADVIRARRVSRSWMSTIDDALQNPCSKVHPYIRRPCLMLLHPASAKIGTCAALSVFEFSSNAWLTKPILFPSKASYLVGASHGLFCFATDSPVGSFFHDPFKSEISFINNDIDFFVGNPLTDTWMLLPRPPSTHCKCAGKEEGAVYAFTAYMYPNSGHSLAFKLFKIQSREKWPSRNNVCIYDSLTGQWDKDRFEWWSVQHAVFETSGVLHCFGKFGSLECSYNLLTRTLETPLREPFAPRHMGSGPYGLSFAARCAERNFFVRKMPHGEFEKAVVGSIPCVLHKWPVGVFRLGDDSRWELVSEMPTKLLKEAVEEGSDGTDFVIGSDHTHRIFFILKGSSIMLVFDVLSSEWDTLPGCAYVPSFYPYKLTAFCEPLI